MRRGLNFRIYWMMLAAAVTSATHNAEAGGKQFVYGYIRAYGTCVPEFGYPKTVRIVSEVYKYCPYGPQPNRAEDSRRQAEQAVQAGCTGQATLKFIMADGPFNTEPPAQKALNAFCADGGCVRISAPGGYYSKEQCVD